jgi:hypothetical protein
LRSPREILRNKFVLLFLGCFFIYHSIFNQFTGQIVFDHFSPNLSSGIITANINKFSLFYGVSANNLVVQDKEPQSIPLLKAKHFSLNYNLPLLLIGRLKISEILLEDSEIFIFKKDNKFNYEKIFIKKDDVSKEEVITESNEIINLYLYISLYLKVTISNFNLHFNDTDKLIKINNLSTSFEFDSKRFNKIILDSTFIENIDYLSFIIQPNKILDIYYKDKDLELKEIIDFYFYITKGGSEGDSFSHEFILKLNGISPTFNEKKIKPLTVLLNTKASFLSNKFSINKIFFIFFDKKFIDASGQIDDISDKDSIVNLDFIDSIIDLDSINEYLKLFQGKFPNISGKIYLSPLKITGTLQNIELNWSPTLENLRISSTETNHFIQNGNFNLVCNLNLFLKENEMLNKLSYLKEVHLDNLYINYNKSIIRSSFDFLNPKIEGYISIKNLNLSDFSRMINGKFGLEATLLNNDFNNLNISINSEINNLQLYTDNFNIKPSNLKLKTSAEIFFNPDLKFQYIKLKNSNLNFLNANLKNSVELISTSVDYNDDVKKIIINDSRLNIFFEQLIPLLPSDLSSNLRSFQSISGNPSIFISNLNYNLINEKLINGNLTIILPGINLSDLKILFNIKLNSENKNNIEIKDINIKGFKNIFALDINGKILNKKIDNINKKETYLNINSTIISDNLYEFTKLIKYSGKTKINLELNNEILKGLLFSDKVNLEINKGECPGINCSNYMINNLFLNILLNHNLNFNNYYSILEGDKSNLIKTNGMNKEINFKIDNISGSHPIDKEKSFFYIQGNYKDPGITARVDYNNNMFSISNFNLKTLNGNISSKNIQVNINKGSLEKIQYLGNLQVRDVDLTELIPLENRKKIDDGKIRGDINFSGENMTDLVNNTEIFFSIYKIGKDFGNSAINIVSPPNIIRDYIVNSYSVDKIEAELSKGLVYINILFKQGILSNLLTKIENNKISQERMPLNNFINRAQDEFSTYKK